MTKVTFRQRVRYRFDNIMARGTAALVGSLAVVTIALVLIVALVLLVLGAAPEGWGLSDLIGTGLAHTIDAATVESDSGPWLYVGSMIVVAIGGIFIFSSLIGILSAGLDQRLEELRKGRSFVVEENHTVILGWSDQVFTILSELAVANANQRRACVAILAPKDKVEMDDAIRDKVPHLGRTHVVCRSGSPMDLGDLRIINLQAARSIIVLTPEGDDPDASVIKTVLAVTNGPDRRPSPYHIVAEISDSRNLEAAHLVGGTEASIVEVGDVIARLIVQTCRQSGLSSVYTELLDFEGDEIYFKAEPALTGKSFGEAMLAYADSTVIGLQRAGAGPVMLNPPMDTVIAADDQIVAISEDDDTVVPATAPPVIDPTAIVTAPATPNAPERTLLLGWNRRASAIIRELDNYVLPGSELVAVADWADAAGEAEAAGAACRNMTVRFQAADTSDRRTLEGLDPGRYNHVVVLCYAELLDMQRADARTLVTLLHLRDIEARTSAKFSIVSEMLDDRNRRLAEVTKADDFIVSDKLISLMLAQISENQQLYIVFSDLFSAEGSEIYLKPATDYIQPGRPLTFYTVVEAARRRGEVAIGYRRQALSSDAAHAYGVVVNPTKSDTMTFEPGDRVIVLAES